MTAGVLGEWIRCPRFHGDDVVGIRLVPAFARMTLLASLDSRFRGNDGVEINQTPPAYLAVSSALRVSARHAGV